jgi:leucyl aminopeptidase
MAQKKVAASCKVTVKSGQIDPNNFDGLLVPVYEGEELQKEMFQGDKSFDNLKDEINSLIKAGEIKGTFREFTIIHSTVKNKLQRSIVLGLGKKDVEEKDLMGRVRRYKDNLDHIRSISAQAARTFRRIGVGHMTLLPDCVNEITPVEFAEAATEGVIMGLNKFEKYSAKDSKAKPFNELIILVRDKKDLAEIKKSANSGEISAIAVNESRSIINMPANKLTADALEKEAKDVCSKSPKLTLKVFNEAALRKMNYDGLIHVGAAGSQPPRLLELTWKGNPKSKSTICIIGKGIIYDSGGLGLKPDGGGPKMKYDMAGAGTMLGVMRIVRDLDLPVNVLCLLPVAENLIAREGFRAGDVLTMANGITVEVEHTDAEGRLILADALCHAGSKNVDMIIDAATLTGGVTVALGNLATGLLGNNQKLIDYIEDAGEYLAEKHWQLPMFAEYGIQMKSSVADTSNLGGRGAQTSTATMFLQKFVPEGTPWAHLDIAGTGWIGESTSQYFHKPYLPKSGATAHDVRTVARVIRRIAEEAKGKKTIKSIFE